MEADQLDPGELEVFLLGLFPPTLRASVLEDKSFRDRLELSVDANIRLDQIGVTFRRSTLFKTARDLLNRTISSAEIADIDKSPWIISFDEQKQRMRITRENKQFYIPDFSCLSSDRAKRLAWFDQEIKKFVVNDTSMRQWRVNLDAREVEDEEADTLLNEFRLTPHYVASAIVDQLHRHRISVSLLVPDNLRYYDRLVGKPGSNHSLKEFYDSVGKPRVAERLSADSLKVSRMPFCYRPIRSVRRLFQCKMSLGRKYSICFNG
jgi:hypothetical protein